MSTADALTYASSIMTVISFITFSGILLWSYMPARKAHFDVAAQLPFADELQEETHHG